MKHYSFLMLLLCILFFSACKDANKAGEPIAGQDTAAVTDSVVTADTHEPDTYFKAIERFMTDSIGAFYSSGEFCIPCVQYVATDESNADDILVWGDYWVFNYNLDADTLKTVSGGSHPGLMHVKQTGDQFAVVGFDRVGDGSDYLPSAKRIFGDKFDKFQAIYSDADSREEHRAATIAQFVKKHNIPATFYQDFGWPAIELPRAE